MIIQPYGDSALILTFEQQDTTATHPRILDCVLAMYAHINAEYSRDVVDIVPAAETIVITVDSPRLTPGALSKKLERIDIHCLPATMNDGKTVTIPVHYDGPDLGVVAHHLGIAEHEVTQWHSEIRWYAAFGGFAPGFMYLVAEQTHHAHAPRPVSIPRLATPRTKIPAGSVALAGHFSAVYPHQSPGGWQIIGHTTSTLWDVNKAAPSLISPGDTVRFVEEK
ncbi:allophanate hydrolase subunit 1 [Corynebacterium sp. sy017]|uniref:5-oxoprolinase subunit B family protein n=1 Tax=unclassified Corynebacterium TaxID=2624378 RepID=UPI0011854A1D|nr:MULTISPECIES: allophanate hydrolase subunit 1 [unclassified Corynebacterium]MBP3088916.1 allophanate hydrolase subunit 1 [Corynebacterium sp. sy017]TSD91247.1 allophanate hydrolase subunit 1 [Corynebacterium sp. SY003]